MMRFVLAPDSFKESMTAKEVCIAMEKGIKKVFKDATCIHVPMADGGEGTLQSLIDATNGTIYEKEVTGPLGNKVKGKFGVLGTENVAIIEMAQASGIQLVPMNKRNPLITTTYGTGELIKEALNKGVKKIIIGLGGSATNDGGAGMLQALGVKFLNDEGNELLFGGESLKDLKNIDISEMDKRIFNVNIEVACDVKNPLIGENGATKVFAKQKGASEKDIDILENSLKNYSEVVLKALGKNINVEGAGAAGGLGAALLGFCNAKLLKGIDIVIKYSLLKEKIKDADYVFTGEGSIDFQTKFGKTPIGVASLAKSFNIPVIALAGRVGEGTSELYNLGITSIFGILKEATTLEEALKKGPENIEKTTENICRLLKEIKLI